MSRISNETIQMVKQSIDIVDVVNQYVPLTKRGNNYTCSCPFHEDRNPSFSVSQSKQIFKCFSCGRGGTVFRFLEEIEGISFVEAVQKTAEYGNIPLEIDQHSDASNPKRTILYEIHEKTQEFYHYYLTKTVNGKNALDYFLNRQISMTTIEQFHLGLAPLNSEVLLQFLQKEGFDELDLLESGIFYQTDDRTLIDRFRGRLIIPLRNEQGSPIAFSGRIYDEQAPQQDAKYLNSPQTDIFDKSSVLFNLDQAKGPIRQSKEVLVTEGYMDVITLFQAGFENTVASMGTSLTNHHLSRLSKLANTVYFLFDGDSAGKKATLSAFEMAQSYNKTQFKAITIPQKMDPDDWIKQKGVNSFQRLINQAETSFDFQKEYYRSHFNLEDDHQLAEYLEHLIQIIKSIDSTIEQQLRLKELSEEFNVDESILKEQLTRVKQENKHQTQETNATVRTNNDIVSPRPVDITSIWNIKSLRVLQSEKYFLFMLIYQEQAWNYLATLSTPVLLINDISCQAYTTLQHYYYDEGHHIPLTGITQFIEDDQVRYFIEQLFWEYELFEFNQQAMEDTLKTIQREFIKLEIDQLTKELKEAQRLQEYGRLNEIITEISRLNHQIKH